MGVIVLFFFVVYLVLSIIITAVTANRASKKEARIIALILFLIPTWDVVLALILFIPSAIFWSGDTIHKTVSTDAIFYDVYTMKKGVFEPSYFRNGMKFVEMKVERTYPQSLVPEKGLYRFWLGEQGKIKFKKIDKIASTYVIKENPDFKVPIIPISFQKVEIINRESNTIVAVGKNVKVSYLSCLRFPFFNWANWDDRVDYHIRSNTNFFRIEKKVINTTN